MAFYFTSPVKGLVILQVVESNRPFTRNFGTFTFWNQKKPDGKKSEEIYVCKNLSQKFAH